MQCNSMQCKYVTHPRSWLVVCLCNACHMGWGWGGLWSMGVNPLFSSGFLFFNEMNAECCEVENQLQMHIAQLLFGIHLDLFK